MSTGFTKSYISLHLFTLQLYSSVKKMQGYIGLCIFLHHSYLVGILFGVPFLYLFPFKVYKDVGRDLWYNIYYIHAQSVVWKTNCISQPERQQPRWSYNHVTIHWQSLEHLWRSHYNSTTKFAVKNLHL